MATPAYPWYQVVQGEDIGQGDFLEGCPVFLPPEDLAESSLTEAAFRWEELDVIVMSQTCDMVQGREKISDVLLCPTWRRSQLTTGHLATPKGMEDVRRGNLPGLHLLADCNLPDFTREVRVVDFRRVHTLPLEFVRRKALTVGDRLRLLPPYREHLSQAFARFFMRVGLPVDVPPFR